MKAASKAFFQTQRFRELWENISQLSPQLMGISLVTSLKTLALEFPKRENLRLT